MKPHIINNCQRTYRINVKKIIRKIIDKIPSKFVEGLDEVLLLDFGKKEYPTSRYIPGNRKLKQARIEIYMDNQILKGIPLLSILALNIFLLLTINQHIDKHIKTKTEDKDILTFNKSRINYNWMYLGIWNPLLVGFKAFNYLFVQRQTFRIILRWWTNKVLKKTGS